MKNYLIGSDLLGEGVSDLYIVVNVKSIDPKKLAEKMGKWGGFAGGAVGAFNKAPRMILQVASPLVVDKLAEYGIDGTVEIDSALPGKKAPKSEFVPGAVVGGVLAGLITWLIVRRR